MLRSSEDIVQKIMSEFTGGTAMELYCKMVDIGAKERVIELLNYIVEKQYDRSYFSNSKYAEKFYDKFIEEKNT